jgi:hypothetical protein
MQIILLDNPSCWSRKKTQDHKVNKIQHAYNTYLKIVIFLYWNLDNQFSTFNRIHLSDTPRIVQPDYSHAT